MAVYFIQAGEGGAIKIGHTTGCPWFRLSNFQVMHFADLRLLGVAPGRRRQENKIQLRFARHWIRGEWFAPHPDILAFAAKYYVEQPPTAVRIRRYATSHREVALRNAALKAKDAHAAIPLSASDLIGERAA